MKATMKRSKDCKHSVVYARTDDKFPIRTVYVDKIWMEGRPMPQTIELQLTTMEGPDASKEQVPSI